MSYLWYKKDKETVLIPKKGTEEGNNIPAIQVHSSCLQDSLSFDKEVGIIYAIANK
jgi:hypothetical protein